MLYTIISLTLDIAPGAVFGTLTAKIHVLKNMNGLVWAGLQHLSHMSQIIVREVDSAITTVGGGYDTAYRIEGHRSQLEELYQIIEQGSFMSIEDAEVAEQLAKGNSTDATSPWYVFTRYRLDVNLTVENGFEQDNEGDLSAPEVVSGIVLTHKGNFSKFDCLLENSGLNPGTGRHLIRAQVLFANSSDAIAAESALNLRFGTCAQRLWHHSDAADDMRMVA